MGKGRRQLVASAPEGAGNDKRTEKLEGMFKDGETEANRKSDSKWVAWIASVRTKVKLMISLYQILNQARASCLERFFVFFT